MVSYAICLSLSDLFHLIWSSLAAFLLLYTIISIFFNGWVVFHCAGKSHGWRSLVGYSLWGPEESDTTEWLHFHFSLSCSGEAMATHSIVLAWRIPGTGALWAAVYGVTQSRTRLTWLSSSSILLYICTTICEWTFRFFPSLGCC